MRLSGMKLSSRSVDERSWPSVIVIDQMRPYPEVQFITVSPPFKKGAGG
jgi:hypothetical protein